jgi:hypothetical protein
METRAPAHARIVAGSGPLPQTDVYLRTLRRAAELIGDEEALARRLKVTPSHLALWMQGLETPPTHIFLRAVDLVSERDLPKRS